MRLLLAKFQKAATAASVPNGEDVSACNSASFGGAPFPPVASASYALFLDSKIVATAVQGASLSTTAVSSVRYKPKSPVWFRFITYASLSEGRMANCPSV